MSDSSPSNSDSNSLILVETAFLASAASLIWFVNYYFPMGPVLRLFFSLPMALLYLRWGKRSAVMGAVASFLLLLVLMGPTRSIVFLIPYGWLGVVLGGMWKRKSPWWMSIGTGSLIVAIGFSLSIGYFQSFWDGICGPIAPSKLLLLQNGYLLSWGFWRSPV
jgi:Predicted membrane protein